jgi:peroxiredoxin
MKKTIGFLLGAMILVLLLVYFSGRSGGSRSGLGSGPETGKQAPSFKVAGLGGKPVTLENYSGKVLVLNFWATWCPPCREEIPHFSRLYSQYKAKGVEFLGVSMDDGELDEVRDLVRKFGDENRVEYLLALGTPELANDFGGIPSLPTTFVIDRTGKIVKKYTGYSPAVTDDIEQTLKNLAG